MRFIAYGKPAPQGSKDYMGQTKTGRGILREASDKVHPWRADVMTAARQVLEQYGWPPPMEGPLIARMVFTMPKPASAPKRRRTWPTGQGVGDLSKLARATEDALEAVGLIANDKFIVEYTRLAKVYPGEDLESLDRPGAQIAISYHPGFTIEMPAPVVQLRAIEGRAA